MATVIEPEQNGSPIPEDTQGPGSESPLPRRRRRLRLKGFSWRRHWPIVAGIGVLSVLWLLPVLIAHTPIIDGMIRNAASDLNGTVHVESASLGWFSPLVLRGVEVRGADGQPLLEIAEARGNASLLGILFNKSGLGHFRLHGAKLNLVLRDGGSNLEDAIAAYLTSTKPSTIDVDVEATDGTVVIQESRTKRQWEIDQVQLRWIDPLAPGKPTEWKVAGVVAEGPQTGKIEAALTLGSQEAGDGATLKTENVSLAMFESLARRWVPGLRVEGRSTSSIEARWGGKTVVGGQFSGEELRLRLPALGQDEPRLAKLQANGQFVWDKGQLQCDRVSLKSDFGSVTFDGRLDLSGSAGSNLAATLAQSWDFKGQ